MQNFPDTWSIDDKISYLQRRIILASIIYYDLDDNIISDAQYEELSKQLLALSKNYDLSNTTYGYAFQDYDGSTGFHLPGRLKPKDRQYMNVLARTLIGKATVDDCANVIPKRIKKRT